MSTVHAGVSRQVISPPPGIYLMGYGNRIQGNTGIHDDLYVTTLVLDDGNTRAALFTVDHTFIHPKIVEQTKASLQGILPDSIFICCSHTHAGPIGYADEQSSPEDRAFINFLVGQLVASFVEATSHMQTISLWAGQSEAHININRRERMTDGTIVIGNNPEGLVDHSVQILQVRTQHNVPLATLVNYACHPVVMGPLNRQVSADWVGAMRRGVEAHGGGLCLFIQGATADVNPRKMQWQADNWDEVEEQGSAVAAAVHQACASLEMLNTGAVWARQSTCWLPLMPANGYNTAIRAFLPQAHSDKDIRAALREIFPWHVDLETRDGITYSPVQIGVLRVGGWALAALGTEPFTETGLAIKAASPARMTFVAGYTNGCNSYLPIASTYKEGGYEVETAPLFYGMPSGFAPGGAEFIVDELKALFGDDGS